MLKIAFAFWLASCSADVTTTYQAMQYPQLSEQNPMLSPLRDHPAWMSAALAGEDAAGGILIHRFVQPHHKRLAIVLFLAEGAAYSYFAVHNVQNMRAIDNTPRFIPR